MILPSLPSSNLLEQAEGVEAGLQKIQKIGRVGQYGFLFTIVLQIVLGWFESGVIPTPAPGSIAARAITAIRIGSLLILPLFLLLFTWSRFWLRQSREPFRYTCRIESIGPMPSSRKVREMAWLAGDLEELLSQRIDRIQFLKGPPGDPAGPKDESHIQIGGSYVVRARDDDDKQLVLEIMPHVGIGPKNSRKLAYPVSYPPDPASKPLERVQKPAGKPGEEPADEQSEIALSRSNYKALLERVYSSVATEIYRQIQMDVAEKIELMPTRFLQALALYYEAEDYARSNTLHGYAEAGRLYEASARLFDPCFGPLPVSPLRRAFARPTRWGVSLARRAIARCAPLHLGLVRRDIMYARALTGCVNMLLYGRVLASISGQRITPAFEAQRVAQDALERLSRLTVDAPGCREALFDAHVSLALAYFYLGKREDAAAELNTARSKNPAHDRDIRFQLVRSELALREKQASRHLVNLAPRWETAQWSVAFQAEWQWRARPTFEPALAENPLGEYQRVIDLNPGNIGAWANRGYLFWLLDKCNDAKASFGAGRDYKMIKQETFVAELDYGLARIAAEQGEFLEAYRSQEMAVSDLIAPSRSQVADFRGYYFDLAGDALLSRFERYRAKVETHLVDPAKCEGLPSRMLNSVYAFVLNDYGECCRAYYERTGDLRYYRKADDAFELASQVDPENPLALHNLRQLRVPDLPTPGRKTEAQLFKEIAAAEARIAAAQEERTASAGTSPSGERSGLADVRKARLERVINLAQEEIRQLREKVENARMQTREAKRYDQKIRELYPYWTVGMFREAETNAREAFVARSDARMEEETARNSNSPSDKLAAEHRKEEYDQRADLLQDKVKRNIRDLVPHHWLWTVENTFNWDAVRHPDPWNERRWEKQFNDIHTGALTIYATMLSAVDRKHGFALLDHIRRTFGLEDLYLLQRLRDLSADGPRTTHTKYDLKMRTISERLRAEDPYSFATLWWTAENPFTDHERMEIFVDAAGRPGLSGALYRWLGEEQLLQIARRTRRKRALLEPIARKMERLSKLVDPSARPFPGPADGDPFGDRPVDSRLVSALDKLGKICTEEFQGNGIDKDEIDGLEEQVPLILAELDGTLNLVRDKADFRARLARGAVWIAYIQPRNAQLKNLLDRYRAMEKQCREGLCQALKSAVSASKDPDSAVLWSVSARLAEFGHFEPALEASKKAAQIDAGYSEVAPDREKLLQAVKVLRHADPAEYSTHFRKFLELVRQPPARSQTATAHARRRCALLALLERFDTDNEPFLELKQAERWWRAAIATEIDTLAAGGDLESEPQDRWPAERAAFRQWIRRERTRHAADPQARADCHLAEITLARHEARSVRDRTPSVPGAKSLDLLPLVTPLALEIATDLLGGGNSPSIDPLIKSLFPQMRKRVQEDTGVMVPGVRMRDNDLELGKDQYLILVNEIPLVMGTADRCKVFVRGPHGESFQSFFRYTHASEGSRFPPEGKWREPEKTGGSRRRERTEVWDHLEYITRHVESIVRLNLVQFFGVQEADNTLGTWLETRLPHEAEQYLRTVRADHCMLRRTTRQLQGLLRDRVPLTRPERVAAGLRAAHGIGDPAECRRLLREPLREQLWGNDGEYMHFRLSDSIEAMLNAKSAPGERFSASPEDLQEFFSALRTELPDQGTRPALVIRGERLRYFVRYLIREEWPEVPVLADCDLVPPLTYDTLTVISME
jgi:hypothetical protein